MSKMSAGRERIVKITQKEIDRSLKKLTKENIPKITPLEVISYDSTREMVHNLFIKNKKLSPYQIPDVLGISYTNAEYHCKTLHKKGILDSRKAVAIVDGQRKNIVIYSLKEK